MKIVIPMAGMGKRMRPHTLTIPKPLIPIAGKPIVQRIVEDIAKVSSQKVEEVAFIIGDFGKEVEQNLIKIAETVGAKGSIYYQEEALGTAHAILCAKESLGGNVIVAFADTLFKANFKLDETKDGIIWVQKIDDPSAFGVVKLDETGAITDFVEKPTEFVSDLAIIGIYYFKDGENLKNELQYLIDNDIKDKGEFQLTDALENMRKKGLNLFPGAVDEWLDCGNKNATVYTNQRILKLNQDEKLVADSIKNVKSTITEPCYIGENVVIENSTIGPFASIGDNSTIKNSTVKNAIVQTNTVLDNVNFSNSMVGNFVDYKGDGIEKEVSIGDYSTVLSK